MKLCYLCSSSGPATVPRLREACHLERCQSVCHLQREGQKDDKAQTPSHSLLSPSQLTESSRTYNTKGLTPSFGGKELSPLLSKPFTVIFYFSLHIPVTLAQGSKMRNGCPGPGRRPRDPKIPSLISVKAGRKHRQLMIPSSHLLFHFPRKQQFIEFPSPKNLGYHLCLLLPRGCSFPRVSYFPSELSWNLLLWQRVPPLEHAAGGKPPKLPFCLLFLILLMSFKRPLQDALQMLSSLKEK